MSIPHTDAYFSVDIEADGPVPGPYSMLSFGIVYVGRHDGKTFRPALNFDDPDRSFYAELQPISAYFDPDALAVSGLDRDQLINEGQDPISTMENARRWVLNVAGPDRPTLVAFPLCFDWMWMHYYFTQYTHIGSPFGHASGFDIKTAYAAKKGVPIAESGKSRIDRIIRSSRPHTHNALQDALEQADIFVAVMNMGRAVPETQPLGESRR